MSVLLCHIMTEQNGHNHDFVLIGVDVLFYFLSFSIFSAAVSAESVLPSASLSVYSMQTSGCMPVLIISEPSGLVKRHSAISDE